VSSPSESGRNLAAKRNLVQSEIGTFREFRLQMLLFHNEATPGQNPSGSSGRENLSH